MSKLKSTKPICYRWYKVLAGIAVCIICLVTWIFIINPLLTWDKHFTVNLIKKLSGSHSNQINNKNNVDDNVGNLTFIQEEILFKNTTNYAINLNEIKNNRINQNIENTTKISFLKTTEKASTKIILSTTTKMPSQTFLKASTLKTTTFNYKNNELSIPKTHHETLKNYKIVNYTNKENVFKTTIGPTTQSQNFLENRNNFFNKKINVSKETNFSNQKSPHNEEITLDIFKEGKLFEETTKKSIYKFDTTTVTYLSPHSKIENFNNQTKLLFSNNKIENTTKPYSEGTKSSQMKNNLINSNVNTLSTKILYPQHKIYFQTTLISTTIKKNYKISTTPYSITVTTTEKPLPSTTTTMKSMPISTTTITSTVTSTVRSQFFANENNFKEKNSLENLKNDKKISFKNNAPVIVTALLDIGRGKWQSFYRPFETYLNSFLDLLKMDNNMIIYGDKTVINFVKKHFKGNIDDKLLLEISMKDLPFYRYKSEMQEIIDNEQKNWISSWDKRMRNHPESLYADYNILVNSKPYFLYNASIISPFSSDIFIWIDAGYSHGDKQLIPKYTWDPFLIPNKVHIIKLTPKQDQINTYTYERVYRKDISVISAGFIGASRGVINRFYNFFYKTFIELLDDKKVDDDQTVILITIKNYASLFYVIHGGWFDAFRLLPNLDDTFDKEELKLRYNPRLYQSTYPYWKIHNNSTRDKVLN